MELYLNCIGDKIEFKPFYHTCLKNWKVSRYENGQLDIVYENKDFDTYEDCVKECKKHLYHWTK